MKASGTTRPWLRFCVVVADGIGGVQRFFQVAFLQPVVALLGVIGPDAGIAVGLQFLAHQQTVVAFHPRATLAGGLHLLRNAEQCSHVMTDLMGDHIGLGKSPAAEKRRAISSKNCRSR